MHCQIQRISWPAQWWFNDFVYGGYQGGNFCFWGAKGGLNAEGAKLRLPKARSPSQLGGLGSVVSFHQLRLIRSCMRPLPLGAAKANFASLITLKLDRCNILIAVAYSNRCSTKRQGSYATGGNVTTSRPSSVMFYTGYQSHSPSSKS